MVVKVEMQIEDHADEIANLPERCGSPLPVQFPHNEMIDFCVSIAEENLRQLQGENDIPRTVPEIADWF